VNTPDNHDTGNTEDTDVQSHITRYWSEHGHAYDAHPVSRLHMETGAEQWRAVWASALPSTPADVLDIGTGTGQVAIHLWELGHRVTGIDLAEGMLDLARHKAAGLTRPPDFRTGDAVEPPFDEESFDVITARYLLWTLREPSRALARWLELLKPGGRLAIVDATWFEHGIDNASETPDRDDFYAAYRPHVVEALTLAEAGEIAPFVDVVRQAGFHDVRVRQLPEIRAAESALTRDPDFADQVDVRMQFLITGHRQP